MIQESNINDPIAASFLNSAREFCRQRETFDWKHPDVFIENIHKTLIRLYSYGLDLPLVELTKCYADRLELEKDVIDAALQNLKKNTPFQYYWNCSKSP